MRPSVAAIVRTAQRWARRLSTEALALALADARFGPYQLLVGGRGTLERRPD